MVLNIKLTPILWGLTGILLGYVGWNTGFHGFSVLILIPALGFVPKKRLYVFIFFLSYYLGATKELPFAIYSFYNGNLLKALLYWIISQLILTTGWIIFWEKNISCFKNIIIRQVSTYFITIFLPPYALIGIAHPVTAAGYFFPGTKFWGIGLYILSASILSYIFFTIVEGNDSRRRNKAYVYITLCLLICFVSNVLYKEKQPPTDWTAISTKLGRFPKEDYKIYQRHVLLKVLAREQLQHGKKVIIFPETIAGNWTKTEKEFLEDIDILAKKQNAVILLGAQNIVSETKYDNALVALGDTTLVSQRLIKARVPIPVVGWKPLSKWSAKLNINTQNNGVIDIDNKPTIILICYEQMLIWPVLQSMCAKPIPESIILVSNIGWATDEKVSLIMNKTVKAWCRIFNAPVLRAVNKEA